MKNLIIASSNQHKIDEIRAVLPKGWSLKGLKELGITQEIPETGTTIEENSRIKARFLRENFKDPDTIVIADDSGLEVYSLNGAPGVYSARYAGEPKNDEANNKKLLKELSHQSLRNARFVTIITLLEGEKEKIFEGEVKGTIAFEPRGTNGFGYDPLFIPQGYRSAFAELPNETKNTISHRANAVKKLLAYLMNEKIR
jgi:XTP/dITP diphosphohydrolase